MKLNIKNMNSDDCLQQVKQEFVNLGLADVAVEIGRAEYGGDISADQFRRLNLALTNAGFELPEYNRLRLVGEIKDVIIEYVQYNTEQVNMNFSDYLSARLKYDYTYLANVFSKHAGMTIEKCIITHKIHHAMALIRDCGLKLTVIAKMLHYSSIAHFSNQFKQVSGLTPSAFKKQNCKDGAFADAR